MPEADEAALKTQAEIDKLKAEAEALRRPISWANWIPLIAGLGALVTAGVGGMIQWRMADVTIEKQKLEAAQKVNEAESKSLQAESKSLQTRKEVLDAQEQIAKLKSERAEVDEAKKSAEAVLKTVQEKYAATTALVASAQEDLVQLKRQAQEALAQAKDPAVRQKLTTVVDNAATASTNLARGTPLVYLQFRGGISRDTMKGLQSELQEHKYLAPGAERIGTPFDNQVKYFRKEDEEIGTDVAKLVREYFAQKCPPAKEFPARLATSKKPVPPQQLEVWISLNCGE